MASLAIHPPVHLKIDPDRAIRSVAEAADALRQHAIAGHSEEAGRVLQRLERAATPEQAEQAGADFRAWAKRTGLFLTPPEDA